MINYEAMVFVQQQIPEAHILEKSGRLNFDVYKTITCLTGFLRKKFLENDMAMVKKSLDVAEDLYRKGDGELKTAIENILVFSFSGMMSSDPSKRKEFKSLIPRTLFVLYVHQIVHSDC